MINEMINQLKEIIEDATSQLLEVNEVFSGETAVDKVFLLRTISPNMQSSMNVVLHWFLANHPRLVMSFWKNVSQNYIAPIDFIEETAAAKGGFIIHASNLAEILFDIDPTNTSF